MTIHPRRLGFSSPLSRTERGTGGEAITPLALRRPASAHHQPQPRLGLTEVDWIGKDAATVYSYGAELLEHCGGRRVTTNREQLFLKTLADLEATAANPEWYGLIKASGLLRLLLLEGDALVHQVNRDYGLKLEFRFHALPKLGQENVLAAWTRLSKSANPNDQREPQTGNLDDFLTAGCLGLRGRNLTVGDVIRANAHLKGGVHVGRLRQKDVGEAGVLVMDQMLNVGGAEASLAVLRDIIQVTLEGLKPLAELVRQGWAANPRT